MMIIISVLFILFVLYIRYFQLYLQIAIYVKLNGWWWLWLYGRKNISTLYWHYMCMWWRWWTWMSKLFTYRSNYIYIDQPSIIFIICIAQWFFVITLWRIYSKIVSYSFPIKISYRFFRKCCFHCSVSQSRILQIYRKLNVRDN